MQNGDKVFVAFVSGDHLKAFVSEYTVIDAQHRVVKREATGDVRVLESFESCHLTEAAAWEHAARETLAYASNLRHRAEDCLAKAAAARIVMVPA